MYKRQVFQETFSDVCHYLKDRVEKEDIILTTGCGNVDELAEMLVHY